MPTTIRIKQEMSESDEMDLDINHDMEHVCKQEEASSDESMPTAQSQSSVGRKNQVKEEQEVHHTLSQRKSTRTSPIQAPLKGTTTKDKKRHVRRRLTYDDISYFDIHHNDDHDDHNDQDPSMNSTGGLRSSRGFNEPRTRDHYHIQTRSSKRRTRSSYRTSRRAMRGGHSHRRGWTKKEHLQRRYGEYGLSISGSDFVKIRFNRVVSCTTIQSGVETNFNIDRLMRAWRIDKETSLNTIRATTQQYKRKQDPKMTRNINKR